VGAASRAGDAAFAVEAFEGAGGFVAGGVTGVDGAERGAAAGGLAEGTEEGTTAGGTAPVGAGAGAGRAAEGMGVGGDCDWERAGTMTMSNSAKMAGRR
jgi:hypothetical protein